MDQQKKEQTINPSNDNTTTTPALPSSSPPTQEVPPPKIAQREEQSTGWGWGWFSSAVNTVKNSDIVRNYVKPTLDTVGETTNKIVEDIAKTIDISDEDEAQSNEDEDNNKKAHTDKQTELKKDDEGTEQAPAQPLQQSDDFSEDPLLAAIDKGAHMLDKGTSMIETSLDYIGSAIQKGAQKTKELANPFLEKSKQRIGKGVKAGSNFANKGLTNLEYFGEKALHLLTLEEETEDPTYRPATGSETVKESLPAEGFDVVFEASLGVAHLTALENLSIGCMMKTQKKYRELESTEKIDEIFAKIQDIFDKEEQDDEAEPKFPTPQVNEKVKQQKQKLDSKIKSSTARIEQLIAEFQKELEKLNKNKDNEQIDFCSIILSHQQKMQKECMVTLAELSALSIEHLLRIAEFYLVQTDVTGEDITSKAYYIYIMAETLSDDITGVSMEFIDNLSTLSSSLEGVTEEERKSLDDKTNTNVNNIYLDAGTAISNLQEAKKFAQQICKFLVFLIKAPQQETKTEEKQVAGDQESLILDEPIKSQVEKTTDTAIIKEQHQTE